MSENTCVDQVQCRVANNQVSEARDRWLNLIDYFVGPSSYLDRFNSYHIKLVDYIGKGA
jgi:hypothetical protein